MPSEEKKRTATQLLEGLLKGDDVVLLQIYEQFYEGTERFVLNNNGTKADAKDIFHDGLQELFLQARDGLQIKSSFGGYLHTICRKKWLNRLRRQKLFTSDRAEDKIVKSEESTEEILIKYEQKLLFRKHFSTLTEKCKQVLGLIFKELPLVEVADQLGFTYNYIRKRSSECRKKLVDQIKKDPLFKELS